MGSEKQMAFGSAGMLLLKLLEEKDRYGYQMIEELARRSDHTFDLKAGTLYPLLHSLEEQGYVRSYDGAAQGKRVRKFYQITPSGRKALAKKEQEWTAYTRAVNQVLRGGLCNG